MIFDYTCPISGIKRENTTIRMVAGQVLLVSLISLYELVNGNTWLASMLMGALAVDFIIRGFFKPEMSPLVWIAKFIVKTFRLKTSLVDQAPKLFAARVGFLLSAFIATFSALGWVIPALVVGAILVLCAGLECFINFCVGCWMYSMLPSHLSERLAKTLYTF